MSVFKHIKEATYQIELLTDRLPNITNPQQQQNLVNLINAFITLINDCEALLQTQINTNVIDKLLLARMYSQMVGDLDHKINIHAIARNIDTNLEDSKELLKHQIITLLQQKEIENIVNKITNETTKNNYVKLTASENELNAAEKQLKTITSEAEYNVMIEELLTEFKQHIKWN